ncbi:MAG: hypothetical protein ACYTGN_13965 [Planctomycetota bacterium]|jgi:glucose-6-phosphate isomerase
MGFTYEVAEGGSEPALERADEAAARLADASFVADLSAGHALPGPTSMDRVVVLGIGGSALGARTVHEACGGPAQRPITVVDNIDPYAFERAFAAGDPVRTAWVVVSKSGGTMEPLTQFAELRRRVGDRGEIHVVTGPSGALRDIANEAGYPACDVPEPVGGRFSVFTPAATAPLALAGHDVPGLIDGARAAATQCARPGGVAARFAARMVEDLRAGRNVLTLWSYAERLECVGEWFRQLWAESLGKQRQGQTPLHCVGSTDQHSIQQLMVEGPPDKTVLVLSGPAGDTEMDRILQAMRRATTAAMVRAGCPGVTIRLDDWSERSLGALLMTLLCATVIAGDLMGVDPYGQPGVEAAKIATKELLANPGGPEDQAITQLLAEGQGTRVD